MRELFKWASVLDRSYSSYMDKKLAPLGINTSQYFYILKICESPGITQDSIFKQVHRNPSNITRALAHLEAQDYITKKTSRADKRTCHLYPTQKALEDHEKILGLVMDCIDKILCGFSEEEKIIFQRLLCRAAESAYALNQELLSKNEKGTDPAVEKTDASKDAAQKNAAGAETENTDTANADTVNTDTADTDTANTDTADTDTANTGTAGTAV